MEAPGKCEMYSAIQKKGKRRGSAEGSERLEII